MSLPLVSIEVPTTSYHYQSKLKPEAAYFWSVKAEKPFSSEWSATFSFITQAEKILPVAPQTVLKTPLWVFVVIAAGSILVITILVLILRQRMSY